MKIRKQNENVITLNTQNNTLPPKGKKSGSKMTRPVTLKNHVVKTTGQVSDDVNTVSSLITQLRTSHEKLGFIPLTNINEQYNSLVEECQNANNSGKYQPLYSHTPAKNEINDLLWGLDRVITYRTASESLTNEFINNPLVVLLDLTILDPVSRFTNLMLQNLLDNGPKVGVCFILMTNKNKLELAS